jgi:hypothetical protein
MNRWFMLENGKHHKVDEALYLHYANTCNVHDVEEVSSAHFLFGERATAMPEVRLAPSHVGWVAIYYERKGIITFFAQISEKRAAWQRIEWLPDFDHNWDDNRVREAIEHFLWVAQCEDARRLLPQS